MGTWNLDFCQQMTDNSYSDSMFEFGADTVLKIFACEWQGLKNL